VNIDRGQEAAMSFARTIRLVAVLLVAGVAALTPDVSWAVDAFLKIDSCQGAETTKGFEKQIRLSGFNARIDRAAAAGGAGTAQGKLTIQPIEILKDLDLCSPQFFLDAVTGKHIKEATITFVREGDGKPEPYFMIKLTDLLIIGIEHMTVTRGQSTIQDTRGVDVNAPADGIQEVVTLSYSKIQLTDMISKKTVGFDAAAAKKL
jgi:type VI secretion system Hcp family effector